MKYFIYREGEIYRVSRHCFDMFVTRKADENKAVGDEIRYYFKGVFLGYIQVFAIEV